ncbi:MAG: sigma-70 family RNA polymerase sigma factor [Chitinivibrionales bacterium]|nr:sigma-70 family RNA polymerase sigma factor [Chitinivibrionales bacterium]MBD3396534.1 sigma-70 family RNA polymerase sigma factor [Chitinivibrionales bacterium]
MNGFFVKGGNLNLYLREISKHPPLPAEQEAKLAQRIRKNDEAALARLVKANLRFVVSVARNYQNQGLPLEDLINEGNLGLIRAARRFDEKKNFKFISYAVWWIRQSILQALANQSRIVRLPLNCVGKIYKVGKVRERLEQKFFRSPNEREVSRAVGLEEADVTKTVKIGNRHTSLHDPIAKHSDKTIMDCLVDGNQESPDDSVLREALQEEIDQLLKTRLTRNERYVIMRYFGIGQETANTLDEIGERSNLTRERVRQIKNSALQKLRSTRKASMLKEYIAG